MCATTLVLLGERVDDHCGRLFNYLERSCLLKTKRRTRENMEEGELGEEEIERNNPTTRRHRFSLHSGVVHVLMTSMGELLCFMPFFLGTKSCVETTTLRASLSSNKYGYSSVALIVLTAPLAIEMIVNGLLHACKSSLTMQNRQQQSSLILDTTILQPSTYSFNTSEKILFILGAVIQPLVAFLPPDTTHLGLVYICCQRCQIMLVCGTMATWLCRYDPRYFSFFSTSCVIGFMMISFSLLVFGDNLSTCDDENQVLYPSPQILIIITHHLLFVETPNL